MQIIISTSTSDFWDKIIPFLALSISIFSLWSQQKHNKNSVRPLGKIRVRDYENYISVSIINKGTGPLIIDDIQCVKQNKTNSQLIKFFPSSDFNFSWEKFSGNLKEDVLSINDEVFLISITDNYFDNIHDWEIAKSNIRLQLKEIEIKLIYKNIYNQKFLSEKKLTWFGRHN